MIEYGASIMAERARRRLSQVNLARRLGIYPSTLVEIEQASIGLDEQTYRRILEAIERDEPAKSVG